MIPGAESHAESLGWKVAQFGFDHPTLTGCFFGLFAVFLVSSMVCSAIKFRWPVFAEMPPNVRLLLGFLMPLALNWWTLSKKVGGGEPQIPAME
jgi:hypothetical protein